MSRAVLTINSTADRQKALAWLMKAPEGTRVEFKGARRSTDQNSLLWARLTDIAIQAQHNGRKYTPEIWKSIFMHGLGREIQFIPSLDGKSFLPLGLSSSDLSKAEMTELLDFIAAWASENGIVLRDTPPEPTALQYMGAG